MKVKDINNKSEGELQELLKEEKAKLVQFRFEMASRQLKNHAQIKESRKNVARILGKLNGTKETK